jgi:predicted NUDIX family phosphoesterase
MSVEERVLCFERRLLEELGLFQGLSLEVNKYLALVTSPHNLVYRDRSEAENDKRYKQIIPYVVIVSNDRVLHYRRGSGGEETRLHGKFSIGIGGHISDQDHNLFSEGPLGYFDGMWREVKEEVDIEPVKENVVAVINDDSTEVGFVHFAFVHIVHVTTEKIVGRRKGILAPEFVPISEAVRKSIDYESWSRLCLENIDVLLSSAATADTVRV